MLTPFELISTWRSMLPIVEDRPLALCDSRSVDSADLIPCDRVMRNRVGEVYYLRYSPGHEWLVAAAPP
jgi:hypothetical protein